MSEGKDLVFLSSKGNIAIRYDQIIGWQRGHISEEIMGPHPDPKLADKGEILPTGKIKVSTIVRLLLKGEPLEMTPSITAEFFQFIEERIRPEVWQAKQEGVPEVYEIDKTGELGRA